MKLKTVCTFRGRSSITWWGRILLSGLVLLAACAEVGRPPGGPKDETPPELTASSPGSLAVGVSLQEPLRLSFSEKVQRKGFARALETAPAIAFRKEKFDDLDVLLSPEKGWPADSVVVWTLLPTLKDRHGVPLGRKVQGAFSTAGAFPPGKISGSLHWEEELSGKEEILVELLLPAEEGSRRQTRWRWAQADAQGNYLLQWLDLPSGPFELRAFIDKNANGRRDEREAVATLDSLSVGTSDTLMTLALLELIDLEAPVDVWACFGSLPADSITIHISFTSLDKETRPVRTRLDSLRCAPPVKLVPGSYRIGAWKDLDGDGTFGPDSTGISEPFLPTLEWKIQPAKPESLLLDPCDQMISWAEMDTLKPPPLPEELFWKDPQTP